MCKKISIIMGAYNCELTLRASINSILEQTYNNWEFIICDDGSTDNTYEILNSYKQQYPDKFIILRNEKNFKLAYTLNRCLEYATGYYIARMDADDLSKSNRLEAQVHFLNNNPKVDLVGTAMQRFDNSGLNDILYPIQFPDKYTLINTVPFFHATIMARRTVYEALNGYKTEKKNIRAEDLELWYRFYEKNFSGVNITTPLYFVKEDKDAVRRRSLRNRFNVLLISLEGYRKLKFPKISYIKPIIEFLVKASTPFWIQDLYRNYQKNIDKYHAN